MLSAAAGGHEWKAAEAAGDASPRCSAGRLENVATTRGTSFP